MHLFFLITSCLWLAVGCVNTPKHSIVLTNNVVAALPAIKGPTLFLKDGDREAPGNPIATLMYFLRLVSDEPVIMTESEGNTQEARVLSVKRLEKNGRFKVYATFEITGGGQQRNEIDHSRVIRAKAAQLSRGEPLKRRLSFINIKGAGRGEIVVEGLLDDGKPSVDIFTMNFASKGKASPVTIGLHDVVKKDEKYFKINGQVARVKSLVFRRSEGRPKMEAMVDSLKPEGAGNNVFQNFVGRVKGSVANLFIPPISIKARGNQAMLEFGQAIVEGRPSFTFPSAR